MRTDFIQSSRVLCLWRTIALGFFVVVALLLSATAHGHTFEFTDVVSVLKSNGTYQIDITVDVDALALGVSPALDSAIIAAELRAASVEELNEAIDRARDTLRRRVRVRFDDTAQEPHIHFPDRDSPVLTDFAGPTVLGITARFVGTIPKEAREFTLSLSAAFQNVHLTILDQATAEGRRWVLEPGEESPPYRLGEKQAPVSSLAIIGRYLKLGYEHILPKGLDHILFVLGLFLLTPQFRPLLWQITAFTVAHSITLALSMYDVVSLPSRVVESLIALSIAYVAVENIASSKLHSWRVVIVFAFGLLHGLGFAGVLRELGLPREEFVTALVSFNVGVEIGQISVVLLAYVAVGWFQRGKWYRPAVVIPASVAIAGVGLFWTVQRAVFGA